VTIARLSRHRPSLASRACDVTIALGITQVEVADCSVPHLTRPFITTGGEAPDAQTFVPATLFREFQVGDIVVTAGRTITEADVVMFAGLTGDYNQLHTDAEFRTQSMFGQRVAHGLLGLSIALGMATRLGFIEGTVLAFRELTWKFSLPILIGDTIHVKAPSLRSRRCPGWVAARSPWMSR